MAPARCYDRAKCVPSTGPHPTSAVARPGRRALGASPAVSRSFALQTELSLPHAAGPRRITVTHSPEQRTPSPQPQRRSALLGSGSAEAAALRRARSRSGARAATTYGMGAASHELLDLHARLDDAHGGPRARERCLQASRSRSAKRSLSVGVDVGQVDAGGDGDGAGFDADEPEAFGDGNTGSRPARTKRSVGPSTSSSNSRLTCTALSREMPTRIRSTAA